MTSRSQIVDQIREAVGSGSEFTTKKQLDHIDGHSRTFIAHSPMMFVATADAAGSCDCSPRGDPPGFVHVVNAKTLLIPDRKGNRRVDSMRNIASNPRIGLLFVVPGRGETLRINGAAEITTDETMLEECAVDGKVPKIGILVEVEELYFHCARAFHRSGLWDSERWPDASGIPSLGTIFRDQARLDGNAADVDADLDEANRDLY